MYSVQTLLISLSFLFLLKGTREGWGNTWRAYIVCTTLAIYLQYTSIFAVLAQNVFVIICRRKDPRTVRCWLLSQCAVALLFAPCLPLLLWQTTTVTGRSWIQPLELPQVLKFISLFSGSCLRDSGARILSVLVTMLALVTAVAVLWRKRENRETLCLLALWFILPISVLLVLSLRQNLFLPRTLVYTTPALALLVGCTLAVAEKGVGRLMSVVMGVTLASANISALDHYHFSANAWVKSDLRQGADEVARDYRAGDVIVHSTQFSYRPFQYYLAQEAVQGVVGQPEKLTHLFAVIGDGHVPENGMAIQRIWLVLYSDFKNQGSDEAVHNWMDQHHRLLQVLHNSPTLFIALYERQGPDLTPAIK